jgi:hypothetical protein
MWHNIENVAENFFLDKTKFKEFAKKNISKYNLIVDKRNNIEVSTMNADDLINDFKKEK